MATRVGFIGLGQMGKNLATNIQRAGFDLMVYDLRQEPLDDLARLGAKVAESPRDIADHSEIIALAVPDDQAVDAALVGEEGALDNAKPGTLVAIHSTIHPNTAKRLAERGAAKGVTVIDAQ